MFSRLYPAPCECKGTNPWTSFITGEESKTYGYECTKIGSSTGDAFCFVDYRSSCPDKQRDGGSNSLNFNKTSNWNYSYAVCKG